MRTVIVFGASGMLGHAICNVLSQGDFRLVPVVRSLDRIPTSLSEDAMVFDALADPVSGVLEGQRNCVGIINAIGIIKPHIDELDSSSVRRAIEINSIFPFRLAQVAADKGIPVLQIATDCVYSGNSGAYVENDKHDALDVYGKTKSLGEVPSDNVFHLRASIIGRELGRQTSLMEWVLAQPKGATINGYVNHKWNGVTTHAFASVCSGILKSRVQSAGRLHLTPANSVTKYDLLLEITKRFGREDLRIVPTEAPEPIDRTLRTLFPDVIAELWRAAGYQRPPTVAEMIASCP